LRDVGCLRRLCFDVELLKKATPIHMTRT